MSYSALVQSYSSKANLWLMNETSGTAATDSVGGKVSTYHAGVSLQYTNALPDATKGALCEVPHG